MNKRTIFLSVVLAFLLMLLVTSQARFSSTLDDESRIENDYLTEQVIASDLIHQISQIQSLTYKIPLTANTPHLLDVYMGKLSRTIQKSAHLIQLLESGGIYVRTAPLNLPGMDHYTRSFSLRPPHSIPEEVIHLKPRIKLLETMRKNLETLSHQKLDARKHHKPLNALGEQITYFTKSIDSIFRRMTEDANQIYYEAQKQHTFLVQKSKSKKTKYNYITIIILFTILFLFLILLRHFIRELQNKIDFDRLTGLYSRAKLEGTEFTEQSLLILIDMDDFSDINSLYGMAFGNTVLRNQAGKLRHFDPRAKIFRVAGDVFGVYYAAFPDDDTKIQERIISIQNLLKDCTKCQLELSVTIAAAQGTDCLHDAYTALDIANTKDEPWWIYHDESQYIREVKFNRLWHDELKAALDHDAIVPFFHPIVDQDKKVIHYETLMRLKRSNGKTEYISPSVFLEVAKKTKLYLPISRRLIEKAFVFFSDKPEVSFTINLSYEDMEKEPIQAFLAEMIEKYHAKDRVIFEVLETSFVDNPDLLEEFIAYFRSLGVKFAIDDFGAGYSNLKRVVALNPDYLKIDGSLIQAMIHDRRSHKMVENIVEYAREFGIKTVAEYVSTPEIFAECQRLNMDYCQGYYFAEPSPQLEM